MCFGLQSCHSHTSFENTVCASRCVQSLLSSIIIQSMELKAVNYIFAKLLTSGQFCLFLIVAEKCVGNVLRNALKFSGQSAGV